MNALLSFCRIVQNSFMHFMESNAREGSRYLSFPDQTSRGFLPLQNCAMQNSLLPYQTFGQRKSTHSRKQFQAKVCASIALGPILVRLMVLAFQRSSRMI